MEKFDEEDACDACRDMWLYAAKQLLGIASDSRDPDAILACVEAAEKAYWKATGTV